MSIIFKIGRIIYMAIMIASSMLLTFMCFTCPVMKYITTVASGNTGFNLIFFTWLISIVIGGTLFFATTSAIYCILTYVQIKPKYGKHAAKVALHTFIKMMKKI